MRYLYRDQCRLRSSARASSSPTGTSTNRGCRADGRETGYWVHANETPRIQGALLQSALTRLASSSRSSSLSWQRHLQVKPARPQRRPPPMSRTASSTLCPSTSAPISPVRFPMSDPVRPGSQSIPRAPRLTWRTSGSSTPLRTPSRPSTWRAASTHARNHSTAPRHARDSGRLRFRRRDLVQGTPSHPGHTICARSISVPVRSHRGSRSGSTHSPSPSPPMARRPTWRRSLRPR